MPPHLEKIRDRLAENIHELWGMNKIELGWTFGKVRRGSRGQARVDGPPALLPGRALPRPDEEGDLVRQTREPQRALRAGRGAAAATALHRQTRHPRPFALPNTGSLYLRTRTRGGSSAPLSEPLVSLSFQKSPPFCAGGERRLIYCLESEFV